MFELNHANPDIGEFAHAGLIVQSLRDAEQLLGSWLGYGFAGLGDGKVPVRFENGLRETHLTTAWSSPPGIELILNSPGSIWTSEEPIHLHHLAYWVDDLAETSRRLESEGLPLELFFDDGSRTLTRWAYHRQPDGLRIELISNSIRDRLETQLTRSASGP